MELTDRPLPAAPGFLVRAVLAGRRATQALSDGTVPAELALWDQVAGITRTMMIGAAARLGIADLLVDGPRTATELAERTGQDADALHRTLRALATGGVFAMRDDGRFENSRLSEVLRSDRPSRFRDFAIYFASGSNVAAWRDFDRTLETGESAFERVHGKSVWAWFDEHADERETFARAMQGITMLDAPVIASTFPFDEARVVCDVGGGRGTLLSEILVRHPHLKGVLVDGPGVLASAEQLLRARGVLGRVERVPGSFFDAVPRGADTFVLKNVLHDWDDARSVKILRVVRAAMEPGQRLLVCEALVEKTTTGPGALSDVQMMIACDGGRERGVSELAALFDEASLRRGRVWPTPTVSVIEAIAV